MLVVGSEETYSKFGGKGLDSYSPLKVESGKYEEGVKWLYSVLYALQLSTERITIVANKMLNDISR